MNEPSPALSNLTSRPADAPPFGNGSVSPARCGRNRGTCRRPGDKQGAAGDDKQHRQPKHYTRPSQKPVEKAITPAGRQLVKREHRKTEADSQIGQRKNNNKNRHWRQPELCRSITDRNGKESRQTNGPPGAFRVHPNPHEHMSTRHAYAMTRFSGVGEVAATELARSLFTQPAPRLETQPCTEKVNEK